MKNKYISPNKVKHISLKLLPITATALFVPLQVNAADTPNLFANDNVTSETTRQKIDRIKKSIAEQPAEQTVFDVYAVGKFQGTALVTFTDNWVKIETPNDILDQMPAVKTLQAFLPLFTDKIYNNEPISIENVGSISADPLNFKININIAEAQATRATTKQTKTVNSTSNHVSFSNRMRFTGSSDFDPAKDESFGLNHNMSLSRGHWSLNASGNYVKSAGYDFSNMFVEHAVGDNIYAAGMLSTNGTRLAANTSIYGIEIKSNQRNQGDVHNYQATPIEIFIPSESRVRIYRNSNQLVYSDKHEFGLQSINTKRFPSGSYPIRIEITEDDGTVIEENRFFQKNSSLIPRDHAEFEFTLGIERDGLDLLSNPVYQFSYATRLKDNLELNTTLYGVDSKFVIEPKIRTFFGNGYEYDAALSITSESDTAFITNLSYTPKNTENNLSWYARALHTLSGHQHDFTNLAIDDFTRKISQSRSSVSGNLSYTTGDVSWAFSAQFLKSYKALATYSYGPSLNWRLYYKNGHYISTNANLTKTRNNSNHGVFLTYRYQPQRSNWHYNSSVGHLKSGESSRRQITQNAKYDNRKGSSYGTSIGMSSNYQIAPDSNSVTSNLSINHDAKNIGVTANYQAIDDGAKGSKQFLDYALDSTFLLTQDSLFDVEERKYAFTPSRGGKINNIIVDLKGNAIGEEIAVLVNGLPKAYGKVGEKITFSMPAYGGGKVSIKPSKETATILDYDKSSTIVKLYPGNIAQQEWTIHKVSIYSGRAVDQNGQPIAWQRVEGTKNYTTTDGNGYFQMEMLGSETPFINTSKNKCIFALPTITKEEAFTQVGDITCS